jgi:hypothetical protein
MKLIRKAGATSEIWQIFIADSSSTTGAGLTGLTSASSGLTAYYHRNTDTTATAISLVTMTVGTFTSSGFKEIDSTNLPGWYQFCPPNAALASGAKSCAFHLKGATNMAPLPIEVQLVSYDPDDAVRLGLTAMPNVASGSAGAILTDGTGTAQITSSSGQIQVQSGTLTGQILATAGIASVNAVKFGGTSVTPRDIGASVLLDVGTGTGQVNLSSGKVPVVQLTASDFAASSLNGKGDWNTTTPPTAAANATAVWTDLLAGSDFSTSSSIGKLLKDDINATISSRSSHTAGDVWDVALSGHTTAGTTGAALNAESSLTLAGIATAVWQDSTAGDFAVAGSIGKSLFTSGNVPGAASGLALVGSNMGTVSSVTGNVGGTIGNLTSGAKTDVENAVWNAVMASHVTAGTTGAFLNSSGSAADPWQVALPGSYASGTAGNIVGNNLNATVASRLATSGYTAPDNTTIGLINAKTTNLTFTTANKVDAKLTADGLDNISATPPTGLATTFATKILQVWERLFGRVIKDDNLGTITLMQGTGSTPQTTQTFTSTTTVDTINRAT